MDLFAIVQILLRRWKVVVAVLAMTAAAAAYVQSAVLPEFEAEGSVLLSQPELDPSRFPQAEEYLERALREGNYLSGLPGNAALTTTEASTTSVEFTVEAATTGGASAALEAAIAGLREAITDEQVAADIPEDLRLSVREELGQTVELPDGSIRASATASVIDPTAERDNPFNASESTGRIIEVAVESDAGRERFEEAMGTSTIDYRISQESRDAAAIMAITTSGPRAEQVLDAFDVVRELLDEELDARQSRAQVPRRQRVTVEVLAAPQDVEDVSPPVSRAVAGVVVLGGLLAIGLALLVDILGVRRRRKREQAPAGGPAPHAHATPTPTDEVTTPEATATAPPVEQSARPAEPTGSAGTSNVDRVAPQAGRPQRSDHHA